MHRVAIVSYRFDQRGGSERRTYQLVRGLIECGHEVEIYAASIDDTAVLGVREHIVPSAGGLSVRKISSFTANVRKALAARTDIDIIHNQIRPFVKGIVSVGGGCHASYLKRRSAESRALKKLGFKLNPFHRYVLELEKCMYAPDGCPAIITNSRMSKEGILEHYPYPEGRVFVAYNGVDSERFRPADSDTRQALRRRLGLMQDDVAVLFVGSDFGRKGLNVLIRAMSGLTGFRLVVAGRGDERGYAETARKAGLTDAIFTGEVRDTAPLYQAADVYALPTMYDPFANTTLEAMASALPVITTSDNGVSEVISGYQDGLVMSLHGDADELRAYLELLSDPEMRTAIGARARQRVSTLTWEDTLNRTLEVYGIVKQETGNTR